MKLADYPTEASGKVVMIMMTNLYSRRRGAMGPALAGLGRQHDNDGNDHG